MFGKGLLRKLLFAKRANFSDPFHLVMNLVEMPDHISVVEETGLTDRATGSQ